MNAEYQIVAFLRGMPEKMSCSEWVRVDQDAFMSALDLAACIGGCMRELSLESVLNLDRLEVRMRLIQVVKP